jgi:hypothetical protein
MAKELPYFQFEPAEYLTKDVSFCSLSAQGLFINICSYYWQRQCDLSKDQFLRRFNYPDEFNELVKEGVIDLMGDKIVVKFLLAQYIKATEFSKEQSRKGSLGGRPKKPNKSQIKPELNPNESQTKAIREDKIIKEDIREDNITEKKRVKAFSPPTLLEVQDYFFENGYTKESGLKAFNYYNTAQWKDSTGKQVKNWKQKMIAVWFKDENKIVKNERTFNKNR